MLSTWRFICLFLSCIPSQFFSHLIFLFIQFYISSCSSLFSMLYHLSFPLLDCCCTLCTYTVVRNSVSHAKPIHLMNFIPWFYRFAIFVFPFWCFIFSFSSVSFSFFFSSIVFIPKWCSHWIVHIFPELGNNLDRN